MKFEVQNGSLAIVSEKETLFTNVSAYLEFEGNDYNILTRPAEGTWTTDGESASCDNVTFELSECGDGFLIRSTFTNLGDEIRVPCEFKCFTGTLCDEIDTALINRYFPQNTNRVHEMQSQIDTVRPVYNALYHSAEHTAFNTAGGRSFTFGAATFEKYFTGITVTREGVLTANCDTEWHVLKNGDSFTSEWFLLVEAESAVAVLDKYSRTVATIAGVERSTKPTPTGFCTWYYYAGGIYPRTLRENMAVLDQHREDIPVKYIQIDDGWFDYLGDWNPNEKFSEGMKAMADEIKAHGYIPGLWIAPFACSEDSAILRDHPDWFVKTIDGELWNKYSLDYTNPAVREHMGKLYRTITYDWGFRYVKIDAVSFRLAPGVHFDPDATASVNYRMGLQTIRENLHPDTFLLGCTAPMGGAIGYVDGMRVSLDVFERWESIREVFNTTFKRFHYNRNCYIIDADCLIIRKAENEDDECWRFCTRNDTEIRTYITAMAASGGVLMLSDKLPLLEPYQLELISKLFPVNDETALPLDIMDSYVPGVLDFGKRGNVRTVALINWGDAEREMSVEADPSLVWEFWDHEFAVHDGGRFSAKIAPHAAKVFYFTEKSSVAVCGSDASVVMQTEWERDGETVSVTPLKRGEKIFAASNAGPLDGGIPVASAGDYTVYEFALGDGVLEIKA